MTDVERDGADIIAEVDEALSHWTEEAEAVGLESEWVERVGESFRRFG